MATSSYATTTDLAAYLKDVSSTANTAIWTTLLSVASRFIDMKCGQYFFVDGQSTKFFDGAGLSNVDTGQHPFYIKRGTIAAAAVGATSLTYTSTQGPAPSANDQFTLDVGALQENVTVSAVSGVGPYTLTVGATQFAHAAGVAASTVLVKLAYFENQPTANWTATLSGDGITPPTNYYLWPRSRPNAGSSADPTQLRPYYGLDIAHIPISATTYLPSSIPGYFTVQLTAHWGWPVVPDLIKDLTCKLAARLWRARSTGWAEQLGTHDTGIVQILQHFDPLDEATLLASDFVNTQL